MVDHPQFRNPTQALRDRANIFPPEGGPLVRCQCVRVNTIDKDRSRIRLSQTTKYFKKQFTPPHLSGTQNLKILASLQKKANALTIRAVLEQVGLDPDMKKPVGKYSLGMRQRLGFAQALMEDPSLLILDEPFNGLDKHGVVHIRNVIKGLREEGKTVILASHNQVDIDELCDTVCEMDAGVLTVVR